MEPKGIQFLALCLAVCISVGNSRAPKKIIGGETAWHGEFPYQVSIRQFNQHYCGGSILDATHILTAAHCVVLAGDKVSLPWDLQVVTGTVDHEDLRYDNVFAVSRVINHGHYSTQIRDSTRPTHFADIAVLELARPIPFSNFQKPIGLPTSNTPPGTPVVSIGWGLYNEPERKSSRYLQKLNMKTISLAECQAAQPHLINVGHICAISPTNTGTCHGDSGGPLTHNNKVIGIVSWGGHKCGDGLPGVFTNVYDYINWIKWAMETSYYS